MKQACIKWLRKISVFAAAGVMTTILVSCHSNKPWFIQLSSSQTGINFTNNVPDNGSFDIFYYPYLYSGAGVAVGDINNDGLDDVFFVSNKKGGNKLYLNKGGFHFDDITQKAGVAGLSDYSTGVAMVDINGDGWLDIYVSTVTITGVFASHNELYINNGKGGFNEAAKEYHLDFSSHTTQTAFFDYDRDGDLDCFLLNHAATYTDDYKDISVRKTIDSVSGCKLLRNDNGHFTDITVATHIYCAPNEYGLGIAVGDINNDGWPDIYVSNDFKENDFCYINQKNGTFAEKADSLFDHVSRFSMGNDMADYNNDGWPDIISLDMLSPDEKVIKTSLADDDIETYNYKRHFGFHYQFSKNCLQQNQGGQHFSDVSLQKGIAATDWSWAPLLADFNNDGYKDLFVSNGYKYRTNDLDFNVFVQNIAQRNNQQNIATSRHGLVQYLPSGVVPDYFFTGKGDEGFTDQSTAAGFTQPTLSNGAAYADLDNDGDLDLVVNRMNEPAGIYRNDMPAANYISLALAGNGKNTEGIGAIVYVYSNSTMQCVTQSPVRGFMSSVSPVLHVGLGEAKTIDSLIICWPNGNGQRLYNIKANQRLALQQSTSATQFTKPVMPSLISTTWNDVTDSSNINFIHKEDEFDDLNVQPLLPHSYATQGPKLAVADVNADGLEDFFICGAKGQSGQLYLQTGNGKFIQKQLPAIANNVACEQTGALFFDADGDGDKELYVCSGGAEYFGRAEALRDHLYINDGKGEFTESQSLPALYENKSCVRGADFDRDGDIDLFVGGRVNARMFGYTPASSMLINDGKGRFTEATGAVAKELSNIGMVTDACWTDIDSDGWIDLIVVGEWMPVTVFKNVKGKLVKQQSDALINSSGLWQCIYPADIDGDGDIDFLLGNWGDNTKLKATADYPLKTYIADWDGNGETEPIMAVNKGGKEYPFYGKSDFEKRLPFLKKRFLKYGDFAGKTMSEVFTMEAISNARLLQAATLKTSVLLNEKGQLVLQALPHFLQAAPVFSFAQFSSIGKEPLYLAAGNFYEVSPYEGRYDALLPTVFSFQKTDAVLQNYLLQKGPVRSAAAIKLKDGQGLLLARNNQKFSLLKQVRP